MVPEFDSSTEITKPAVLFQEVRRSGADPDPRRVNRFIPHLDTDTQKDEFCEAYDEMIKHFRALCAVGSEPEKTKPRQKTVAWLNIVFATEPLVKRDGQTMVNFFFDEEFFVDPVVSTREYYQKMVAVNTLSGG